MMYATTQSQTLKKLPQRVTIATSKAWMDDKGDLDPNASK